MPESRGVSFTRTELLARLNSVQIEIPDLTTIFRAWIPSDNPNARSFIKETNAAVDQRLNSIYSQKDPDRLASLKAADFALFTVLWWPKSNAKQLEILAFLVIWLFTWDDQVDDPAGSYTNDLKIADIYRRKTLQFAHRCLDKSICRAPWQRTPNEPVIQSFKEIGTAVRQTYSREQRKRLLHEIDYFMQMSGSEQVTRLADELPSLEQFWFFRLGTSAVNIGLAMGEFSIGSRISRQIMESRLMQDIWRSANMIISITNDLLSLRKEAQKGCVDSLVPIHFAETLDMRSAVRQSVSDLQDAIVEFDRAAECLISDTSQGRAVEDVKDLLDVYRSNCVGNLIWSYSTPRYGLSSSLKECGALKFCFGK